MSNVELARLARDSNRFRGRAVYELADRAAAGEDAATILGQLTTLSALREDRFHLVSMAWAAIVALLQTQTAHARRVAYGSFAALPEQEQENFLEYLGCDRIEDA
ncbi:hypothetical protein QLQ12_40155 [Actinoplanes sp. NEAU-A12]|uniref:Uncharacterized protein n=1 Tax=Actinoplanes sandaracinus TaxID=3045177 RepID=A0ABT6WYK8_9ACTN|nr:hypothetical protein [Actinoplanes sandaracinus]MDI6104821.1 hypothetical protein [Actinoplanes sandaracinus]